MPADRWRQVKDRWRATHWLSLGFMVLAVLVLILAPWPMMDKLQAIGWSICPQRPAHSLFIDGTQLPLEARKVGIFLGFLSAIVYFVASGRGRAVNLPRKPILLLFLAFVVVMGIDSLNALFYDLFLPHLYVPSTVVRLATGLLNGVAVAVVALPVVNVSLWREGLERASVESWREMGIILMGQAVLFVVAISGPSVFLYPLSLLSVLGAICMLGTINTLLLAGVIRWPGRIAFWPDLLPIGAVALLLCGLEMAAMAVLRFALVGTAPL